MVRARQDKYTLGESQDKALGAVNGLITLNVSLKADATYDIGATVEGRIIDALNAPVQGALVTITDQTLNAIKYFITDSSGKYLFNNIQEGIGYNILAMSPGKKLYQTTGVDLMKGENKILDISLQDDAAMQLGIITGQITSSQTSSKVSGAVISLYKVVSGVETLHSVTYSNEYGQFALREIPSGDYRIKGSALSYLGKSTDVTITGANIISKDLSLDTDPNISIGTISGIVTGSSGAVNRADVLLYRIETNGTLTPVAYTKTNSSGVYLFTSVPPGDYRVMSNEIQIVEVTVAGPSGPSIDKLGVSKAATNNPLIYESIKGTLGGPAVISSTFPNFVDSLGGFSDGTVTFNVTAPYAGLYRAELKYLYIDSVDRILDVIVNGQSAFLNKPQVTGNTEATAGILRVPVTLQRGNNTIRIRGNGTDKSPLIGALNLYLANGTSINPTGSLLSNGATIDNTTAPGYVKGLGGATDGSFTFTFNVDPANADLTGNYYFDLLYLSDAPKSCKVGINGVDYAFPFNQTKSLNSIDGVVKTINIPGIIGGVNTIKIHGDSPTFPTPWIKTVTLYQVPKEATIQETAFNLAGSASLSGGFIQNIGGGGDGSATLIYNASDEGIYDFGIDYAAPDANRKLEVIVNGMPTGEVYSFESTLTGAKRKVVTLSLLKGNNTIRFHR